MPKTSIAAEPWFEQPVPRPGYYLLVDEITARCVAEGVVTARLQAQARRLTHWLGATETPAGLYAVVEGGER